MERGGRGCICFYIRELSKLLHQIVNKHKFDISKLTLSFFFTFALTLVSFSHKILSFCHRPGQEVVIAMTTNPKTQTDSNKVASEGAIKCGFV